MTKKKEFIHYKITQTDHGYQIDKYDGDKYIGLMGITQTRTNAVSIAKRLMEGRTRMGWE